MDTLRKRLENIRYARRVDAKSLPTRMRLDEFCAVLETALKSVTHSDLESELRDSLDIHQLSGLETKIRITLTEMCERIRAAA